MIRFATLFLIAAVLPAAGAQVYTGVITDSMCAANHKMMKITPESKCVIECVRMGGDTRYALWDGKNVYKLSDQQTPEKFAAQKVRVTGTLYTKTGIIKVEKIEPAR